MILHRIPFQVIYLVETTSLSFFYLFYNKCFISSYSLYYFCVFLFFTSLLNQIRWSIMWGLFLKCFKCQYYRTYSKYYRRPYYKIISLQGLKFLIGNYLPNEHLICKKISSSVCSDLGSVLSCFKGLDVIIIFLLVAQDVGFNLFWGRWFKSRNERKGKMVLEGQTKCS